MQPGGGLLAGRAGSELVSAYSHHLRPPPLIEAETEGNSVFDLKYIAGLLVRPAGERRQRGETRTATTAGLQGLQYNVYLVLL